MAQLFIGGATIEGTPAELLEFLQQSTTAEPAPERRLAKAGDTVRALVTSRDIEKDAHYLVMEDNDGTPFIVDDGGFSRSVWVSNLNNYVVEDGEPSSADVPESFTRAAWGKTYVRTDTQDVRPGDLVMYLTSPNRNTKAMKLYEVNDSCNYKDEYGLRLMPFGWSPEHQVVVYRKKQRAREFAAGDIVKHSSRWFNREGIGEVVGSSEGAGMALVRGVRDDGAVLSFYLDTYDLQLIVAAENREDTEGTD